MAQTILPGNPAALDGSNDRTDTTFVSDATAVPATAVFRSGRAFTQAGSAYVCPPPAGGAAPQGINFIGGAAIRADGAQIILVGGSITRFINGVGYTELGEMVANTTAPVKFNNGIGVAADGTASLTAVA
jgi:hypothetical protein